MEVITGKNDMGIINFKSKFNHEEHKGARRRANKISTLRALRVLRG